MTIFGTLEFRVCRYRKRCFIADVSTSIHSCFPFCSALVLHLHCLHPRAVQDDAIAPTACLFVTCDEGGGELPSTREMIFKLRVFLSRDGCGHGYTKVH